MEHPRKFADSRRAFDKTEAAIAKATGAETGGQPLDVSGRAWAVDDMYAALKDVVEQIAVYGMIYGGDSCPIDDAKALEAIRQINPCYDPTDNAYWRKLYLRG